MHNTKIGWVEHTLLALLGALTLLSTLYQPAIFRLDGRQRPVWLWR
jgi:hypothetical protein